MIAQVIVVFLLFMIVN